MCVCVSMPVVCVQGWREWERAKRIKKSHEPSTIFTLYAMAEVESSMKIDSE